MLLLLICVVLRVGAVLWLIFRCCLRLFCFPHKLVLEVPASPPQRRPPHPGKYEFPACVCYFRPARPQQNIHKNKNDASRCVVRTLCSWFVLLFVLCCFVVCCVLFSCFGFFAFCFALVCAVLCAHLPELSRQPVQSIAPRNKRVPSCVLLVSIVVSITGQKRTS